MGGATTKNLEKKKKILEDSDLQKIEAPWYIIKLIDQGASNFGKI